MLIHRTFNRWVLGSIPNRAPCCVIEKIQLLSKVLANAQEAIAAYRYDYKKVQVGKDQEKAQSEKDSHSKNRGGKKPN